MTQFLWRSEMPVDAEDAYSWHAAPGALERLLPPWMPVEVLGRSGSGLDAGTRVTLGIRLGPLRARWIAEHGEPVPGRSFSDVQLQGPFRHWRHVHDFLPSGAGCWLEDRVDYELAGAPLTRALSGSVHRTLERIFRFRHERTRRDLMRYRGAGARLHVAMTGSSGLIGTALRAFLTTSGHRVTRLVRRPPDSADEVAWRPTTGALAPPGLAGIDAVVHLAGANVGAGRWSAARRRAIVSSRVDATRCLVDALASLQSPPRVLVAASAVGIYGDGGETELDETSPSGAGFLAEVTRAWEAAARTAAAAGIRVVHLRFGVVVGARGGALARLLPVFRAGLGGALGSGRQWMSWVSLDDVVGAAQHALLHDRLTGPVNVVSPTPVRNAEFVRILAAVLHRPAPVPAPAPLLRAVFGAMAEETLLSSVRAAPGALLGSGFTFLDPDLAGALRFELGR